MRGEGENFITGMSNFVDVCQTIVLVGLCRIMYN